MPYRIVLAQALAGLLTALFLLVFDWAQSWAALLGALVVLVPNAWLAWRITGDGAHRAQRNDRVESGARVLGLSLAKFVVTAGAAALALATLKPAMAGFFAGLVVTVLTAAVVPGFLAPQQLARVPQLD